MSREFEKARRELRKAQTERLYIEAEIDDHIASGDHTLIACSCKRLWHRLRELETTENVLDTVLWGVSNQGFEDYKEANYKHV